MSERSISVPGRTFSVPADCGYLQENEVDDGECPACLRRARVRTLCSIWCPVMILQSFRSLTSNDASFHCISLDLPSIFVSFLQLMMKKPIKKAILNLCRRKIFLPVPGGICVPTRRHDRWSQKALMLRTGACCHSKTLNSVTLLE